MNVAKGDLARVVAPYVVNGRGAIVRVVEFVPPYKSVLLGSYFYPGETVPGWVVEGWVRGSRNEPDGPRLCIADACLRRIDPGDEEDEVLRITGEPEVVHG